MLFLYPLSTEHDDKNDDDFDKPKMATPAELGTSLNYGKSLDMSK